MQQITAPLYPAWRPPGSLLGLRSSVTFRPWRGSGTPHCFVEADVKSSKGTSGRKKGRSGRASHAETSTATLIYLSSNTIYEPLYRTLAMICPKTLSEDESEPAHLMAIHASRTRDSGSTSLSLHGYDIVSLRDSAAIEERSRGPAPVQSSYHWPLSGVDESGR